MMPCAPTRKWWSMRLCPSSPELDPRPPGHTSVADRSSSHVEFNVDAQRKMMRAVYTVVCSVTASSTRTPPARLRSRSYKTSVTIANGLSVSRPVAIAAGNVEDCVLKYPPYGHPSQQALRYWQGERPGSGRVRVAVRPGVIRRPPPDRPLG